jgi:predicted dehydrogenase
MVNFLPDFFQASIINIRRKAVPTWGVFPDKSQQGGGPLIDIGTHALDITLWMMDSTSKLSVSQGPNKFPASAPGRFPNLLKTEPVTDSTS